jgi:hypothetical protein
MSMTDISDVGRSGEAAARESSLLSHLPVAMIFHWTTAVLVVLMFASGIVMTQLGGGALADILSSAHKLTGFCLLVLVLARLTYRVQARLRGHWLPQIGNHTVHRVLVSPTTARAKPCSASSCRRSGRKALAMTTGFSRPMSGWPSG